MLTGEYVFEQHIEFLPQKTFQRIVMKNQGDIYIKWFSCWNQLLIIMYVHGQVFERPKACDKNFHVISFYNLLFVLTVI